MPEKETKYCQNCGEEMDAEAEICPMCGVGIERGSREHLKSTSFPWAIAVSLIAVIALVAGGVYWGFAKPEISVANLKVSEEKVKPGQTVDVLITVKNTGWMGGIKRIDLKVGRKTRSRTVKLEGNSSKEITFKISKDEPGIYNVCVSSIIESFEVVEETSVTASADLQVQDLTARNAGGTTYCSTTVKNVGMQRLTDVTVTIDPGGANIRLLLDSLDPGQAGSDSVTEDVNPLATGETYAVRIAADTSDSELIVHTMTVRVQ